MSNIDKYLAHDLYHLIQNLNVIYGKAEKDKIIKHLLEKGERDGRGYTEKQIKQALNHFETIRLIRQTRKDCYEVLK